MIGYRDVWCRGSTQHCDILKLEELVVSYEEETVAVSDSVDGRYQRAQQPYEQPVF